LAIAAGAVLLISDLAASSLRSSGTAAGAKRRIEGSAARLTERASWDKLLPMQLTIEIPDEKAQEWGMDQEGLAEFISRLLKQPRFSFVDEIVEFLGRGPQPKEIVAFHASEQSQGRVRELLGKSRDGKLSPQEEAELDAIESWNHLFALIRARAYKHLPAAA
jgi:hypothetical protein